MTGTGIGTTSVKVGLAVGVLLGCTGAGRADDAVKADDLRHGLVATFRDRAKPSPAEVTRLEPTIALELKAGEAPHPKLDSDGGTVAWKGYLNVLRGGPYRFSARVRGEFRLLVAGKVVLSADGKDEQPRLTEGKDVELEPGVQPLQAEYTRPAGAGRVELFWQSADFLREPLAHEAMGHLAAQEAALAADLLREHGRFLAEENNCVKCHRADDNKVAKGLATRAGPDLSNVGRRAHAGWIERWLESPRKVWSGASMPAMFSADDAGRVERYAVAHYLASLGGPVPAPPKQPSAKELQASVTRGQRLFGSVGCVACHDPEAPAAKLSEGVTLYGLLSPGGARANYPLAGLGSKTTAERLAEYLQNPLAVAPAGRMPHMLLQGNEALDLARFLCQSRDDAIPAALPEAPGEEQRLAAFRRVEPLAEERAAFARLPADKQWTDLGKRLVIGKGCTNCHTVAPGGKALQSIPVVALNEVAAPAKRAAGCLADEPTKRGKAPAFAFGETDLKALRAFLADGLTGAGSPASAYTARLDLKRYNCLACHSRDGEGGLTPEVVEQLRKFENAENAEAVSPPTLTGVGHKLRTPWLRQVLSSAGRARPWMGLRMPQFGEPQVGKLPEALAALEGTDPEDTVHKVALTSSKIEAGRFLVGKNAFGCISCHDLAGSVGGGTRGPDLAGMNQRVRHEWYLRWLEQPQRMQPGTRMPSIFTNGKSLLTKVFDGHADAQADAIWAYLSLGPGLPLPEGMGPPKGLVLAVEERPVLLRTFMPDAGARAVAVGYPGGVSVAFDAATCRLAYGWSGNFLDASPVWDNRGGAPAKMLGPRFWTAPVGCPVGLSTSAAPPDFAARAKDPAFGGPVPEGKLHDGPNLLHFDGYSTDREGVPTFRYHLEQGGDDKVDVSERVESLRCSVAVGVARRFALSLPAKQTPWLLAGETTREPRVLGEKNAPAAIDLRGGSADVDASRYKVVLPADGERVVVLALAKAPPGAEWHLQKVGGTWQVLLRLPAPAEAGRVQVDLNVWVPYRDDPELLKELTAK
jgi:cbb3-type cytochrome oxidase cytochrome c subunit